MTGYICSQCSCMCNKWSVLQLLPLWPVISVHSAVACATNDLYCNFCHYDRLYLFTVQLHVQQMIYTATFAVMTGYICSQCSCMCNKWSVLQLLPLSPAISVHSAVACATNDLYCNFCRYHRLYLFTVQLRVQQMICTATFAVITGYICSQCSCMCNKWSILQLLPLSPVISVHSAVACATNDLYCNFCRYHRLYLFTVQLHVQQMICTATFAVITSYICSQCSCVCNKWSILQLLKETFLVESCSYCGRGLSRKGQVGPTHNA
jgi:hypothetical protein